MSLRVSVAKPQEVCPPPPGQQALCSRSGHPGPAHCQGCSRSSLYSHHLFWKSADAPGVLLPCLGSWFAVILHFLVSSLKPSHRHLPIFHPDFLVVLSEPRSLSLEVADPFVVTILFYSNISPLLCLFPSFDLNASQICYWSSYHCCFSVESQV